jgi:hypothetical protein
MTSNEAKNKEFIDFRDIGNTNYKWVFLYIGYSDKPINIGKYDPFNKIFITYKKDNHKLRILDALGFNYKFISSYPIEIIRVRYNNKNYFTTKEYLLKNGETHQFENLDKQIFLSIAEFYRNKKTIEKRINSQKSLIKIF